MCHLREGTLYQVTSKGTNSLTSVSRWLAQAGGRALALSRSLLLTRWGGQVECGGMHPEGRFGFLVVIVKITHYEKNSNIFCKVLFWKRKIFLSEQLWTGCKIKHKASIENTVPGRLKRTVLRMADSADPYLPIILQPPVLYELWVLLCLHSF